MKPLIIGAGGVIGNALFKAFSSRFTDCIGLTTKNNSPLITVNYELPSMRDYLASADTVIYCAGVTKFSDCERFPEKSLFLNTQLPQEILKTLSTRQKFVYFSSPVAIHDFGSSAAGKYALHKRMAEERMQQDNVLIVRPSKVIESTSIIRDWKTALGKRQKIAAFFDQFISPVNTALLCDQMLHLLCGGYFGPYNFSARDRLSYLELAKALCVSFKLDAALIEDASARHNNPFFIEQDTLDCVAAQKATGYVPPLSKEVAQDYFRTLA